MTTSSLRITIPIADFNTPNTTTSGVDDRELGRIRSGDFEGRRLLSSSRILKKIAVAPGLFADVFFALPLAGCGAVQTKGQVRS